MWVKFELCGFPCEAKVFEKPSMNGINNGRVSKLFVGGKDREDGQGRDGGWIYERGWSTEPAPQYLIDALMEKYPETL